MKRKMFHDPFGRPARKTAACSFLGVVGALISGSVCPPQARSATPPFDTRDFGSRDHPKVRARECSSDRGVWRLLDRLRGRLRRAISPSSGWRERSAAAPLNPLGGCITTLEGAWAENPRGGFVNRREALAIRVLCAHFTFQVWTFRGLAYGRNSHDTKIS